MTAMICAGQYDRSPMHTRNLTYAVPEPIGRSRDTNSARSNWEGEDLSDDHPRTGTPGGSEEGDVEADEGNHGGNSSMIIFLRPAGGNTNDADNELHNDHSRASDDEDPAAAEAFDGPKGDWGRADVDEGCDEGDEERVLDRAEGFEEDGPEVEDEVDTSQLLHHLHEDPWHVSVRRCDYEGEGRIDSPTTVRRTLLLPLVILPEKQLVQLPIHDVCGITCNSYSWLAIISASSSWI